MSDNIEIPPHVIKQAQELAEQMGCTVEELMSDLLETFTKEQAKKLLKEGKITKKEYDEIHVESPVQYGVHSEEIHGIDGMRLHLQELPPGDPCTDLAQTSEMSQDVPDRLGIQEDVELCQLALNPLHTPEDVVVFHLKNEVADVTRDRLSPSPSIPAFEDLKFFPQQGILTDEDSS